MKIFFSLAPAFNPNDGGVQRTTYKLGKFFTESGLDVYYFSLERNGHAPVEYGKLYHASEEGEENNINNLLQLKEILTEVQPDIVIDQSAYIMPLQLTLFESKREVGFVLLACLRNSLFSVKNNLADTLERLFPKAFYFLLNNAIGHLGALLVHKHKHKRQLKSILDHYDLFILLAPQNRVELEYFVGSYKKEKVISIPNSIPFVDEKVFEKEKIILHVGRLDKSQKRSDLLLPFWKQAYRSIPDWEFWIIGDGPMKNKLEKCIEEENIPRVKLLGYQKPESYFQKAAIFMMPSAFEGFPNTVLEAQSYGSPVLAFNSYAALSWIVNNNKDAILIEPYDTSAMAAEVVAIAQNPNKLMEMGKNAKANAERFTIDKVGMMWLELFQELQKK